MRILFNTMNLGKGGAERVINLLTNELIKENDVQIITHINSNISYKFNENIIIKSLSNTRNTIIRKLERISIMKLLKLKKMILDFKPDIIISFLPEPSFRILALKKYSKKIKDIPIVVSVRNDPKKEYNNKIYNFIMKKLYPYANDLILQTADAQKYFIDNLNISGTVIPNPVSSEFLIKRYEGIREKRIVAVGRLNPQKNYPLLIDAFEEVHKKHDDYILEIYGQGYLEDTIRNIINKKNLNSCIKLMGQVDNVRDAIYKATAYVLSSNYEGMPNALLEAACLGVPCISTDCPCGGPKEILNNGEMGYLVPINNSIKLAYGICNIIENNNYSNRISKMASENSYNYKKDTVINQWKLIINSIIKE